MLPPPLHSRFPSQAKVLPNSLFVIGADTAKRILDKKYYNNNEQDMIVALSEIKQFHCQFLVSTIFVYA
jgi:hypothetical protein